VVGVQVGQRDRRHLVGRDRHTARFSRFPYHLLNGVRTVDQEVFLLGLDRET
jgi:hypothetical protein